MAARAAAASDGAFRLVDIRTSVDDWILTL
jgi:hypothetical protein